MLKRSFARAGTAYLLLLALSFPLMARSREVRYLSFSVKGPHDIMVRDLRKEEVSLFLDKQQVDIRYMGYRDVETAYLLFLENSPRTAKFAVSNPQWGQVNKIDQVRYYLEYDFFPQLTQMGVVLLGQFFESPEIMQGFTANEEQLALEVRRLQPHFNGILMDQIEVGRVIGRGVDLLRDRSEKRKVMIVFTTTVDRRSYGNLQEYQQMLRETDIELFVVSFAARSYSGASFTFEEKMSSFFFKRLISETSGRLYVTGEYGFLEEVFTDLKSRLTNSYTIGFYVEPEEEITEHRVEVRVDRKKCKVTLRKFLVF